MHETNPQRVTARGDLEVDFSPETLRHIRAVIARIHELASMLTRPVLVALDGRSGSGKSTIAKAIAIRVGGIHIEADDFWTGGTNEEWDARTPEEKVSLAIDWRRLRAHALDPLLAGQAATWHPFDFAAGQGLSARAITRGPAKVIILDGAYSARPELSDVLDLKVCVEVASDASRRSRLVGREGETYMSDWHGRWDAAEELYFCVVMPKSSFDMLIANN